MSFQESVKRFCINILHIIKRPFIFFQILTSMQDMKNEFLSIHQNIIKLEHIFDTYNRRFELYSEYFNPEILSLLFTLPKDKKNVLIIGFYGAPNLGDELMLQSILHELPNNNAHITLMLADSPNIDLTLYGDVSILHYSKTKYDYHILASIFDCLIVGGGALLDESNYDLYKPYSQELCQIILGMGKTFIARRKAVYAIGLSTNEELLNKKFIQDLSELIRDSDFFSIRDPYSIKTLETCGINIEKIRLVKDPVWANESFLNIPKSMPHERYKIGIVWAHVQEPVEILVNLLTMIDFNMESNVEFDLIPFYTYRDADIIFYTNVVNAISDDLRKNIKVLDPVWKMDDVVKIFSEEDLIIASRYHGTLIAGIMDIPCIAICLDCHPHYKNKMDYISAEFPKIAVKNLSTLNIKETVSLISEMLHTPQNRKPKIDTVRNANDELKKILKNI